MELYTIKNKALRATGKSVEHRGELMIVHQTCVNLLRYLFGALFFLLLLCPFQVSAASITMEHSLGFNGLFLLNRWSPLSIILENRGRTTHGLLEVVVTSGSEYRRDVHDTTYSMDVELPTNSKKLYAFTIFIDSFTHPLLIRLKSAEKTVLSRSINLRPHYVTKPMVLFVGGRTPPDLSSMLPERVLPIISRPQFLPETWYGYDGVEMLIMHASAWKNLRERQYNALSEWLKGGGFLISSGGLNYGSFLKERIKRLLPIHILGLKRIVELNSLEQFCGQRLTSPDPFLLIKAEIEDAKALIKEGDIPVIIQKDIGRGRILFLAFDHQQPPFTEWSGRYPFWSTILTMRPTADISNIDHKEQEILSSMISEIPMRFPAFLVAFPFMALYVICALFLLKRIENKMVQRWKYLSYLMTVIILFSAASYWFFFYTNSKKHLSYNGFLHIKIKGPEAITSMKYILGLYTLQNGDYRLSFGPEYYPITAIIPEKYEDETLHNFTLLENNAEQTVLISLDKWSYRFLKMNTFIKFPVRGEAVMDEQGLVITIENRSPYSITDCQVYLANNFYFFGNIAPNKKQVKRLGRSILNQQGLFRVQEAGVIAQGIVPDSPDSLLQKIQKSLVQDLLISIHSLHNSQQNSLHLFGWIESHVIPTSLEKTGLTAGGVALLEWEIPVKYSEKGSQSRFGPESLLMPESL